MYRAIALLLVITFAAACGSGAEVATSQRPVYVATVAPVGAILEELVAGRGEVLVLLAPGASPHTYEPRPSDAVSTARARALFYVSGQLDGWAARLDARHRVELAEYLPAGALRSFPALCTADGHGHGHHHTHDDGALDFHFWSDPVLVRDLVPELARVLSELDPEGEAIYTANSNQFISALNDLDIEVREILSPVIGQAVIQFHPSMNYLLDRYGLEIAGSVEPSPGKEATPRYLQQVVSSLRTHQIRALFTEPQLSPRPAEAVAEASGLPLFQLDPLGGIDGRRSYGDLIRYNARTLRTALGQ